MTWICCQLGAREHYAIPRGLHRRAALDCLVTDVWLRPRSLMAMLTSGLGDRFHQDLVNETVYHKIVLEISANNDTVFAVSLQSIRIILLQVANEKRPQTWKELPA